MTATLTKINPLDDVRIGVFYMVDNIAIGLCTYSLAALFFGCIWFYNDGDIIASGIWLDIQVKFETKRDEEIVYYPL